jgi:hypothetical protein
MSAVTKPMPMSVVYSGMNVLVRSKRIQKGLGRHRGSAVPSSPRPDNRDVPSAASAPAPIEARAGAEPRRAPGRSRRDHGPLQDNAVYNCHCGFVFQAAVSTSVDCPHCGSGQAW